MPTIKSISSKAAMPRVAAALVAVAAIAFGWYAVKWQIGSMLGELTTPGGENASRVASLAIALAPKDPVTHWLAAADARIGFDPANEARSVEMLKDVVRLGPNDFRWWVELGRTYENADMQTEAEQAFEKSVSLAPEYTFPHWQLGNFYLREGKTDEAFAELKKATSKSFVYREQVFALAWDYFDHDPAKVEAAAADSPDVRAGLALFFAARGSADAALRVWNSLPKSEKERQPQVASTITQYLYAGRFFREALEFAKQTGVDPEAAPETISNGGFEKPLGDPEKTIFGWRVNTTDNRLDVLTDSAVKHDGLRSLRLKFRNYARPELQNATQLVAVEPGASYSLKFWLRTEDLRTGGEPLIEIVNGNDDKVIASSPRFPLGSNDWQQMQVDFTAPQNSKGVVIRTSRISCGDNCPISGTIWYDDFSLSRRGGG